MIVKSYFDKLNKHQSKKKCKRVKIMADAEMMTYLLISNNFVGEHRQEKSYQLFR